MKLIAGIVFGVAILRPVAAPAQYPPSQLELNGFLLGQHYQAIASALGAAFVQDTTSDGWINRGYVIDRPRHAYMAFKFPADNRDYAYSVQIAGTAGTAMLPFLGVRLGDSANRVERVVGRPSLVTPEPDLKLQLWEYHDRNYSFEIDSTGRLSSIQILGYRGLPEKDSSNTPDPLDRLRRAITKPDIDSLMSVLAPDIEIYRDSTVVPVGGALRRELVDTSSALHHNLLEGPNSLRSVLIAADKPADTAIRVSEHAPPGQVYKFNGALAELVFTYVPGGWRLWEVRFR